MSRIYITETGDMIDDIAFKIYNDETMVAMLLDANPGLVEQPPILPRGLEIILPDAPEPLTPNPINTIWT